MFLRTLVVVPDAVSKRPITNALHRAEALVASADRLENARKLLGERPFDLVIVAEDAPGGLSPEALEAIPRSTASAEIIVLAHDSSPDRQAAWLAYGAFAVVSDDTSADVLESAILKLAERRREQALSASPMVPNEDYSLADYVTHSPAMRQFLSEARRVARLDTTVLLLGETGVGKGLLARSLHNGGPRAGGPFVAVNCGALPETLLESELFGHERGAFTGADRARRGRFELAHNGTLFLDEVAELPASLQVKLLRVLEDRVIEPLGAERAIPVDVRIMAATNRNLAEAVEAKAFREDLYYRLNVVCLSLPALRDRIEDVADIARSYIDHFRARLSCDVTSISEDALAALRLYPWPGNLRELANAIERAVIMASSEEVQVEDLPVAIQEFAPRLIDVEPGGDPGAVKAEWLEKPWSEVRRAALEEAELRYLSAVLKATEGKIGEAARRAGMDPRSLHEKMKKYGLRKEAFRA